MEAAVVRGEGRPEIRAQQHEVVGGQAVPLFFRSEPLDLQVAARQVVVAREVALRGEQDLAGVDEDAPVLRERADGADVGGELALERGRLGAVADAGHVPRGEREQRERGEGGARRQRARQPPPGRAPPPGQAAQAQQRERAAGQREADVEHRLELVVGVLAAEGDGPAPAGQQQRRERRPPRQPAQPRGAGEGDRGAGGGEPRRRGRGRPEAVVRLRRARPEAIREGERDRRRADAAELPPQERRPAECAHVGLRGVEPAAGQQGPDGRQLVRRDLAAQHAVLVAEVEAQHERAAERGEGAAGEVRARPGAAIAGAGAAPGRPAPQELAAQPEQDERRDQPEDVPAQQDGDGDPREQLAEAPLLLEEHHPVEHQHDPEQVGARLGGDHVAVVEEVVRGEREQDGRERDPAVAEQPREREVRQRRGGGEEREHQRPGGEDLPRNVAAGGQHRQLDEDVGADREAVVEADVPRLAAPVQFPPPEQGEAVLRGQVRGEGQRVGGDAVVVSAPVELRAVVAEGEDRGQREQQQRRRQQRPRRRPAEPARPAGAPLRGFVRGLVRAPVRGFVHACARW